MPIIGNDSSGGKKPTTPTIGTAVDGGTGTTVSVPFTPSSYIGKGTIQYTAISNPGSFSATSSGSPITVSGLTTGTAYTFTVKGDTNYGVASDFSAASNSVTPLPPGAFDSIVTVTGTGSSNVITFSNIPQTYAHLQLRCFAKNTSTTQAAASYTLRINDVSASSYFTQAIRVYHNGTNFITDSFGAATQTNINIGYAVAGSANAPTSNNMHGISIIDFSNYSSSTVAKTLKSMGGVNLNSNDNGMWIGSGMFNNTSAITSISLTTTDGNFTSSSTFALYGIKGS